MMFNSNFEIVEVDIESFIFKLFFVIYNFIKIFDFGWYISFKRFVGVCNI